VSPVLRDGRLDDVPIVHHLHGHAVHGDDRLDDLRRLHVSRLSRKKSWALGISLAALAAALFATLYPGRPELTPEGEEAERVTEEWMRVLAARAHHGYWIVVRGTHPGDQVVAAATAGTLTHAAVLDLEREEVIEASGEGVHRTPMRELVAEAFRLQIIRPREWDERSGRDAVERARTRVGARYDWLGTLGAQMDERFYCTELALDAYRARERGWMPAGVVHPRHMRRYGEVVFDSGSRRRRLPIELPSR
jgi:hypothetical protein